MPYIRIFWVDLGGINYSIERLFNFSAENYTYIGLTLPIQQS